MLMVVFPISHPGGPGRKQVSNGKRINMSITRRLFVSVAAATVFIAANIGSSYATDVTVTVT